MAIEETQVNQGLLDAALEISSRRSNTLHRIKELILKGEKDQAWELLLRHLGLDEEKTSRPSRARFPRPALVKGK